MDLKHKLLASFAAVILMVSLVFGFNAYQIARDAAMDNEKNLVALETEEQAAVLAAEYRRAPSLRSLQLYLAARKELQEQMLYLADKDGRALVPATWPADKALDIGGLPTPRALQEKHAQKFFTYDGKHYVWSSSPVAGSPFTLVHIKRSGIDTHGLLMRLAGRLFVAGLILAWIAIWVALIISTAVSRRLTAQTDALRHQSTHDGLTGLPNRTLLQQRLGAEIRTAAISGQSVALIMMDLNRFKEINNTLGHTFGDALLLALGERLQKTLWGRDTVARLGGDEFALLLPMADTAHNAQVTDKVLAALAEPFVIDGVTLEIDASLGIAIYPDDSKDAVELISHADVAMYQAKHMGAPMTRYDHSKDPHSLERLKLTGDLRHAIDRGELLVYYQPMIDIATRQVLGAEALLRWNHPERGLIPPDKFIPLAEQTGIIKSLTYWVLDSALRQCARWNDTGMSLSISVNLSARVVQDDKLLKEAASALARHGVEAGQLKLEITETAIMEDPTRAMEMLTSLSAMGIRLSIDDFGTGYTSMAYLKKLPVDEVKIDKSFVMNMLKDANDAVIARAIIDLAHNMNYTVVAEGVESRRILETLSELACDIAQGYYFSKPVPFPEFESWYRSAEPATEIKKSGTGLRAIYP
jgi:diguanylate cyclase (GGDEF)-like protein